MAADACEVSTDGRCRFTRYPASTRLKPITRAIKIERNDMCVILPVRERWSRHAKSQNRLRWLVGGRRKNGCPADGCFKSRIKEDSTVDRRRVQGLVLLNGVVT